MVYGVARALDGDRAGRRDCAAAILGAGEAATKAALDSIQLFGGNGYVDDSAVSRFLRDAKLYEIGAGTSEIHRTIIATDINAAHRQQQGGAAGLCSPSG
eukprot:GHVU01009867.1.p2 GENE.GHVU01009867.1~~GHVU01009867.1.p2  ORF type:complete len:100 (+),score=18.20 GHVU01009867.1:247-546(+)